jgi:hypothetical protein
MGLFDSRQNEDKNMGSFILAELRDVRKGMEGRDGDLRGELTAVRDAVATLSASVSMSHNMVDNIQTDVGNIQTEVRVLRKDVDHIQQTTSIEKATSNSAWNGPKRLLGAVVAIGAAATAGAAIIKFWPLFFIV